MLKLPTNTFNFIARIFSLCLILLIGYLIIKYGLHDPANSRHNSKLKPVYFLYFLIAGLLFIVTILTISLLGIIKVTVDKSVGTITLSSIIRKTTIVTDDIDYYFVTKHIGKHKDFEGLILNLKTNNKIQLVGQNLLSISDFKDYLVDKNIMFKGEHEMMFPFN